MRRITTPILLFTPVVLPAADRLDFNRTSARSCLTPALPAMAQTSRSV